MFTSLLLNFCLLITSTFAISLTYRAGEARQRAVMMVVRLALTAGATLLLAMASAEVPGGLRIDLRYVPVVMVVLRYGPLWGALVAAPMLLWRLVFDTDSGVDGVVWLHFASVLALSTLVRPAARPLLQGLQPRLLWLTPVPFLGVGVGVLLVPESRELFWVSYPVRLLLGALGLISAVSILQSRLQLLRLTQVLADQANTDALTSLPNRRAFDRDLGALRCGEHLALLDLDHFKAVNDRYGHDGGDRALAQVAGLLRSFAPGRVRAYRVGGEEFAALIGGMDSVQAAGVVERLRSALPGQQGGWLAERGERMTVSIGLATRLADEDGAALFRRADEALYLAKMNGRDRVVVWAPGQGALEGALPSPGAAPPTETLQPRHSAWRALRTTVTLLAQRRVLRDEDWAEMLRLAVEAVDGACCGTLDVRLRGDRFRLVAEVGYAPDLVGLPLTEASQQRWYGRPLDEWRAGTPRLVEGEALDAAYATSDAHLDSPEVRQLNLSGRRREVTGNLCLPVVLGGEVVAHLNLDRLQGAPPFGPESVEVAQLFAQQIAALLHLQGRWDELEHLVSLHERVSVVSPQELAPELTAAAAELLRAQWAVLLRYDAAQDALVSDGRGVHEPALGPVRLPRGVGLAWAALQAGEVIRLTDLSAEPRLYFREQLRAGAMMVVPLRAAGGEPLGALILTRQAERAFSEADAHLALLLGSLAARLLERDHHLVGLQATLDAALETLGVAVELRDFETQDHTRRVTALAVTFAAALGLPPEAVRGLRQGAALHDIGKLAVPDAVLLKPGALDAAERALIETHAERGAALSARIPFLHPDARGVIRSHHERWDGGGYPDRLSGKRIPLAARLFALCDVYDALVSDRPYRAALSPEEALQILARGRGTQFDPELTDRFLALHARGAFAHVAPERVNADRPTPA